MVDYRKVRQGAIKAVKAHTGPGEFNLEVFSVEGECGTTACFLGRLALIGHDGWHMVRRIPTRSGSIADTYREAARYFGLDREVARDIFGSINLGEPDDPYGVEHRDQVTLDQVCAALRRAPIKGGSV